jgi:hypothetical protein
VKGGTERGAHALDVLVSARSAIATDSERAREIVRQRWSIAARMLGSNGAAAVGDSQAQQKRVRYQAAATCIEPETFPESVQALAHTKKRRCEGRDVTAGKECLRRACDPAPSFWTYA